MSGKLTQNISVRKSKVHLDANVLILYKYVVYIIKKYDILSQSVLPSLLGL